MNSTKMSVSAAMQLAARQESEGKLDQAEATYEQILQAAPHNANALQGLGLLAFRRKQFTRALDVLQSALAVKPRSPVFHHNIGTCYRILGKFNEAKNHYRTAIRLKPDYAEAYFNLSAARKFDPHDAEFAAVEALLNRPEVSTQDRSFLHFAAGKMYDDVAAYDRAFEHYRQANLAQQAPFDRAEHARFVGNLLDTFDANTLAKRFGQGCPSEQPVFVVGMPRSGTTLVEQILASHAEVYGAGELPDINSIAAALPKHSPHNLGYPECVDTSEANVLRGFGEAYLKRVQTLNSSVRSARRVVDKSPLNYRHLGLIALLLPQARIIHCRRDPVDTCLSCFFQRFKDGHDYSTDLGHLGFYYRAYEHLMEHWRTTLPLPVLDVDYEALVTNQEDVTRTLIDFCGLKWDDRCLQFHQGERTVTTASNWQVRQPIYRSAVHRWKNYMAHLGPLREALQPNAGVSGEDTRSSAK